VALGGGGRDEVPMKYDSSIVKLGCAARRGGGLRAL
jgi:hypothetical protein